MLRPPRFGANRAREAPWSGGDLGRGAVRRARRSAPSSAAGLFWVLAWLALVPPAHGADVTPTANPSNPPGSRSAELLSDHGRVGIAAAGRPSDLALGLERPARPLFSRPTLRSGWHCTGPDCRGAAPLSHFAGFLTATLGAVIWSRRAR